MDQTLSGARVQWPLRAARVRARQRRNAFEIHGYTGSNGGGKTMAAVYDSLPALAAGRPIVSTCRILDPRTGEPHPLWVPLDDFRLIPDLSYATVILDEVTGVASSRESAGLPASILNRLMQLRKVDVDIRWTTPNWKRADTGIREVTKAVTTCHGLMPVETQMVTEDGLTRTWRPRRLFIWRTYDTKDFDEWSTSKERSSQKNHRVRSIARQVIWGPGSITQDCYDTYETALTLGVVSDAGLCMDCGGARRKKGCVCTPATPIKDPSAGMLRWAEVDAARRHPVTFEIPETDDTPGVLVDA